MADLEKITVTIKNYDVQERGDLDALYSRVRLEDEEGNTFYFKNIVVPKYLKTHGAMATEVPRTWYFKRTSKKSIVVLAFENRDGKVEFDLDDIRLIARATVLKGIVFSIGSIPAAIVAATATFGLGLIILPMGIWYGYRNIFKLPSMLSRKRLLSDFAQHGIVVR
ncbi:hypothetical protein GIV23_13940 [Pseudomonas sp. PA-1-2A]|uniref:hypothetical protein n=1 Tax=Pseudomonas TaxID=286 RepID=UPI001EEF9B7E|nr:MULTISPECIES: hypothetical protein [Pseudomonas]MCF5691567.1 hypothetical protein [Pseudomonas sp. PA-1-8C]MCF5786812.1 hypothetical protein [Pseudomonas sp. PA-1-6G]MCF5792700.1 hypothetical protein [Pseudomonas sp. PA-1-6B]MCF5797509.1 hypothetical protein [Pseudomonas sp. PA-1-5A]MCF5814408.1 hypothetical protein [Pseudomonas sp. PA-1-2A]